MLGTRFVATLESYAHPIYKQALVRADSDQAVFTVCFEGGWPNAPHRSLRNNTFTNWEAAGCPPAGQRPGEGDVLGKRPDGSDVPAVTIYEFLRGQTAINSNYLGLICDALKLEQCLGLWLSMQCFPYWAGPILLVQQAYPVGSTFVPKLGLSHFPLDC